MTKKQQTIAERRQSLFDFISKFDVEGCWWSMNAIVIALDCTKQQLRGDINHLIEIEAIHEVRKYKGRKITRSLISSEPQPFCVDGIQRHKVYSTDPITAFDADREMLTNGFNATQYYGKWTYEYSKPTPPTEHIPIRERLNPNCSIDAAHLALLDDLETLTNKEIKAKYGS